MRFTPEDISLLIGMVSAMLAIYGRFKTEILMQVDRQTENVYVTIYLSNSKRG